MDSGLGEAAGTMSLIRNYFFVVQVFLRVAASTAAESFDGSDYQHVPISDNNRTCSVATAIMDNVTGAFQWYQRKSTTSQASDCIKGNLQRFFFSGLGGAAGTMSLIRNYFCCTGFPDSCSFDNSRKLRRQ
ncbi:hypothetical protein MTO96_050542 [Rhipicephalus appendiculatus]